MTWFIMAPRNHAPPEPGLKTAFIRGCLCTPRDHMTATRLLREQNNKIAQRSRMTRVFAQDADNGRLIPTTSVEQYAEPLGRWFGLTDAELAAALPNLGSFGTSSAVRNIMKTQV
jgi:hypothetical protein